MNEQIEQPQLRILLPRLQDGELFGLAAFCKCKIKQGSFDVPARWLLSVLNDELERRADPSREVGSFSLPNWNHAELSEGLLFSYVLSQHGLTLGAAEFVDDLHRHIVASAVSVLSLFGELQTQ